MKFVLIRFGRKDGDLALNRQKDKRSPGKETADLFTTLRAFCFVSGHDF
jgi:hypothetical protein